MNEQDRINQELVAIITSILPIATELHKKAAAIASHYNIRELLRGASTDVHDGTSAIAASATTAYWVLNDIVDSLNTVVDDTRKRCAGYDIEVPFTESAEDSAISNVGTEKKNAIAHKRDTGRKASLRRRWDNAVAEHSKSVISLLDSKFVDSHYKRDAVVACISALDVSRGTPIGYPDAIPIHPLLRLLSGPRSQVDADMINAFRASVHAITPKQITDMNPVSKARYFRDMALALAFDAISADTEQICVSRVIDVLIDAVLAHRAIYEPTTTTVGPAQCTRQALRHLCIVIIIDAIENPFC